MHNWEGAPSRRWAALPLTGRRVLTLLPRGLKQPTRTPAAWSATAVRRMYAESDEPVRPGMSRQIGAVASG